MAMSVRLSTIRLKSNPYINPETTEQATPTLNFKPEPSTQTTNRPIKLSENKDEHIFKELDKVNHFGEVTLMII